MFLPSAFSLDQQDWKDLLLTRGFSGHALPFWLDGLYKDRSVWEKHVSENLKSELRSLLNFNLPEINSVHEAADGTVKFLVRFHDGLEVETVLIPFYKRFTVCLSTQVGCAMNCSFCYTGTQGYKRNLESGEIVGQYLIARNWLKEKKPKALNPSIVFMGQGEPLQNLKETRKAVGILNDPKLVGIGHRQMTLSTVGYLPGIKELITFPRINIALSLHSPFDEQRSCLIPINEKFPLKDVLQALDEVPLLPRQFITFEYLLIKGLNMSQDHADEIHSLLSERKALINLIPFNPFPGSEWERPSDEEIEEFKKRLVSKKLRVMVRTTKGSDILAACGQLKVNKLARKNGNSGK
ncbi:MAG: 23S rRNA (adenine(2503)-C(2))-methyltransferase RlmN [Bacteriovoracia bacterium]